MQDRADDQRALEAKRCDRDAPDRDASDGCYHANRGAHAANNVLAEAKVRIEGAGDGADHEFRQAV